MQTQTVCVRLASKQPPFVGVDARIWTHPKFTQNTHVLFQTDIKDG
jgi:hypothetical protein